MSSVPDERFPGVRHAMTARTIPATRNQESGKNVVYRMWPVGG
jgi:hypothetical protein